MSDLKCRACGEAYDAFGVNRNGMGDMTAWEAKLFLAGSGCPGCEGVPDEDDERTDDEKLLDHGHSILSNGIDDAEGDMDLALLEAMTDEAYGDKKPPPWKRPEPKELWRCRGCGYRRLLSPDYGPSASVDDDFKIEHDHDGYRKPRFRWSPEYTYKHERDAEQTDEPAEVDGIDGKFCDGCWTTCYECHSYLLQHSDDKDGNYLVGDTYDPGNSFSHPGRTDEVLCVGCYETCCDKCDETADDCNCSEEEEDDDDED